MDIFLPKNNNMGARTYTEIIEMLPENCVTERQLNWRKTKKVEWRWRFFNFDGKKYVEISYLNYDDDYRTYLVRDNKWTTKTVDPDYKANLTEIYYCYCDK
jgi:hypothetical protein